ncbi:HET domain protein [Metarhizium acridum CQMa 102]|uniref:HET domain protein n=1 Tax=Metarhizium acridum (strain CQMa 102) TaxID=655827 RepID=E9DYF7_METAQ|nr:HET domain protein [Metarhizium acridum CQMa 102]EFY91227.1 HET domain protein [Metarhizium acridum CQMa 102]
MQFAATPNPARYSTPGFSSSHAVKESPVAKSSSRTPNLHTPWTNTGMSRCRQKANTFGWQCFIRARPPVRMTSASPCTTRRWTPDSGCCRPSWLCRTSGETQNDRRDVAVVQSAGLAEALGHLPYADSHAVLWIDAVCINQQDLDERARQVSLMAEIYASAERVLAWAGPSAPDSNVAVNLLRRIADSVDVDFASLALRPRESGAAGAYFGLLLDEHQPCPGTGRSRRPWRPSSTGPGPRGSGTPDTPGSGAGRRGRRGRRWWPTRRCTAVHGVSGLGHLLRQMRRTECADPRDLRRPGDPAGGLAGPRAAHQARLQKARGGSVQGAGARRDGGDAQGRRLHGRGTRYPSCWAAVLRAREASSGGTENSNTYAAVGPCNAHGLNWGEALLGPLPEDVRLTWSPSGPVFRNRNTGEGAAADPGIDWDLLQVDAKEDAFVQRANTAGGAPTYKRPDAAYFANKGARPRTLHLV